MIENNLATREGFLEKNIVAVLRFNKLPIFSEITQELKLVFIRSDEFT